MSLNRPSSNERPGDQASQTPSGRKVPMAMSMMVDSMVRMIQKANGSKSIEGQEESNETGNEN